MKESRKIWKLTARFAQFYCAAVSVGILLFFAALAAEAASAKPDPLLDPPSLCEGKIVGAEAGNGVDVTGKPLVPPGTEPIPPLVLRSNHALVPVHTPLVRVPQIELYVDISGLLQPPSPACLTPQEAQEKMPPIPVPKR